MPFIESEDGAVTVDWVVLTAAIVGLGLSALGAVSSGVTDLSGDIESELTLASVADILPEQDAFRAALVALCLHSGGWACDGDTLADATYASLETMTDAALAAAFASAQATSVEHAAKVNQYATMLSNFDADNPDYAVFQGLWTTWTSPTYVESRMAYHGDGSPAAYATYLDNYVNANDQSARIYQEEIDRRAAA